MSASDDLIRAEQAKNDAGIARDAAKTALGLVTPSSPKYAALLKKVQDAEKVFKDSNGKYNKLKDIADKNAKKTKAEEAAKTSETKRIEAFVKNIEKGYGYALENYKKDPTNIGKANSYQNLLTQLNNAYTDAEQQGVTFDRLVVQSKSGEIVPATQVVTVNPAASGGYSPGTPNSALAVKKPTGEALTRQQRGEVVTATSTGAGAAGGAGGGTGGGAGIVKPVKPGKDNKPVDTSWEPLFEQKYPQYKWMFTDLDRTKYADVFDLFKRAIGKGADGKGEMTGEEFDKQFIGTSWYTELAVSKKGRELTTAVGSFNWSDGNLGKFLNKAYQYGYTGDNLKQEAYKELFTKVGGKYVNDLAVGEVKASSPYLVLKRIGTQFLSPVTDESVEAALTGGSSPDDVLRLAREKAKVMYPHLAKSIDAGLSLEELASDYKAIAARTLELDPSQVDMGGIYNVAIKSGEGGKERMLSTSEWETLLRTDSKFKYSFTKQANQDATNIGLSIARAFGKVG